MQSIFKTHLNGKFKLVNSKLLTLQLLAIQDLMSSNKDEKLCLLVPLVVLKRCDTTLYSSNNNTTIYPGRVKAKGRPKKTKVGRKPNLARPVSSLIITRSKSLSNASSNISLINVRPNKICKSRQSTVSNMTTRSMSSNAASELQLSSLKLSSLMTPVEMHEEVDIKAQILKSIELLKKITFDETGNQFVVSEQNSVVASSSATSDIELVQPMECVSSGTFHQGSKDRLPHSQNTQCVCMSACAITFSVITNRRYFSVDDITNILFAGDSLYLQLRPLHIHHPEMFLEPEELPQQIPLRNRLIDISAAEYKFSGLYPNNVADIDTRIDELAININHIIHDNDSRTDGFLFTGQNYTVSFWHSEGNYYLFNSHAVNANGKRDLLNENNNVARLFKCYNLMQLASLLFANASFVGDTPEHSYLRQYSVHKLRVLDIPAGEDLIVMSIDTPYSHTQPLQSDSNMDTSRVNSENESCQFESDATANSSLISNVTKKKGRPKKTKRGRKKSVPDAHLTASKKYNKSHPDVHVKAVKVYTEKNPEINQHAVKTYTDSNKDVHRKAVKEYTVKNPTVHIESVEKYSTAHPEVNQAAVKKHYKTRNVPKELRDIEMIGESTGATLDKIQQFVLKNPSLLAEDVYKCPKCAAPLFHEEKQKKKWCCGEGAYNVMQLPALNEDFYEHDHFLAHSRGYNNMVAFSASCPSGGYHHPSGYSFIKIQGRVHHHIYDLDQTATKYHNIGIFIDDSEERKRLAQELELDRTVVSSICQYLDEVNPLMHAFKRLSREPSEEAHIVFEQTNRRTHGNVLGDMPSGSEIAAYIRTERETFAPRSIVVWKVGGTKHKIDVFHKLYEALAYPLLFSHGTPGWYIGMTDNKGAKLSQAKYYRCLLLSESRFSDYGRLSDEWLVDMCCRLEEERLRFLRGMQNKGTAGSLRSAPLHELDGIAANNPSDVNAIVNDETIQGEGGPVAGKVYLPSTFTAGPRYMKQKYMDGIAIVNRCGKPSYFLTMTCNPKWPEIQQSTPPGRRPSPKTCARVFHLKMQELLRDLRTGAWFGRPVFILSVIEFQKRGLPHVHICLRVEGGGPRQNVEIDKVLRADIPSADEAGGRLRAAVLRHMVHGPCGPQYNRTNLPCWNQVKRRCDKYFPKPPCDTTYVDERGFVHLKRDASNEAETDYRGRKTKIDETWIVPYNAALLLKYDCHFNVDVAGTRKIVKYLFKYLNKGPDEARVAIVEHVNDEIEQYVTKRYIGACSASWQILEFGIVSREPNVKQLSVHLENRQTVFFRTGGESEAAEHSTSDLIVYFNRPQGSEFDELTYVDFYERYNVYARRPTVKNVTIYEICGGTRFVAARQRGELIARLYWVSPHRGEQFFLRLLLSSYPCRGFDALRALGGAGCESFQEAARTLGIANDALEYDRALEEAATFYTGQRLRHFFVLLAVNGAPAALIWEKFKHLISEDFLERLQPNEEEAYRQSLLYIDRLLRRHGSSLVEMGLPQVEDDTTELSRELIHYDHFQLNSYTDEWMPLLSPEQREIFHRVVHLVYRRAEGEPAALFVDGPAGTGKTLLLSVIVAHFRAMNQVVLCTATSGIAALNYSNGYTAHSMFKLPIEIPDDTLYWNMTNGSQRAQLIRKSAVIIYDEAPMAHKYLIHILDRSLRDLMGSRDPFGGKVIIFAGDFRQIPPVVLGARTAADIINASVKMSPLWPAIKTYKLSTAQRTREDADYSEFLLSVGSGDTPTHTFGIGHERETLISLLTDVDIVTNLTDLLTFIFPSTLLPDADACCKRAILSTHNVNVKQINAMILEHVAGEPITCCSVDEAADDHADEFYLGADVLHQISAQGVPDHKLIVKVGCVCIIMRNLSFADRLVNGTKVIIVEVLPRIIKVRLPGTQEAFFIPRIDFKAPVYPGSPIEFRRRQFPLMLSYAMTIHKSQGQTIDRVGVDLRSDCFAHGQLYVALGRVRAKENIKVLLPREKIKFDGPYTKNVVFKQLLS